MNTFSNEQITEMPHYQSVVFQSLEKEALYHRLASATIWLLILASICVALAFFNGELFAYVAPYLPFLFPAYAVIYVLWQYVSFRRTGFAIRQQDILYRRGVFWQTTTILPFSRIQHSEIHHGPLQRLWQLSTLQLFTAGGHGADLAINGFTQDQSQSLRDVIGQANRDHNQQ
ncbi:PH domain-containing protein [Pseudoalteromonas sp. GB56]